MELALAQADRMRAQGHRVAEAAMLLRAAYGSLTRDRYADAIEQAGKALEAAGDHEDVHDQALISLIVAEMRQGNLVARAHIKNLLERVRDRRSAYLSQHSLFALYALFTDILATSSSGAMDIPDEIISLAHYVSGRVQRDSINDFFLSSYLVSGHCAKALWALKHGDQESALDHQKQALKQAHRIFASVTTRETPAVELVYSAPMLLFVRSSLMVTAAFCRATGSTTEAQELDDMLAALPRMDESPSGE